MPPAGRALHKADFRDVFRLIALHILRFFGAFHIARFLTRKQLRILCYHGFAIGDEFDAMPHMFMRSETFERRMALLKRHRYPVVGIDDAVGLLQSGSIENSETVITLDDGWATNLSVALPILENFCYPACIYITTEHLSADSVAFNVALYYMLRTSARRTIVLNGIHPTIDGSYDLGEDAEATALRLIAAAEAVFDLAQRQAMLTPIAAALGLRVQEILRDGRFTFLSADQIREVVRRGIDVQLHTHTHRLPSGSFETMSAEVIRNRSEIEALTGKPARHFCYPSGVHAQRHPDWLRDLGIASATTCDIGLNSSRTSRFLLKRYLDSDQTADIVFEAELSGLGELARAIRSRLFRSGEAD